MGPSFHLVGNAAPGPVLRDRHPGATGVTGAAAPGDYALRAFLRRERRRITRRSTSAPSTAAISSTQIRLSSALKKTKPTLTFWLLSSTKATRRMRPATATTMRAISRVSRFLTGGDPGDPRTGDPELLAIAHSSSSPDSILRPPDSTRAGGHVRGSAPPQLPPAAGRRPYEKRRVAWWAKARMGPVKIPNTRVNATDTPIASAVSPGIGTSPRSVTASVGGASVSTCRLDTAPSPPAADASPDGPSAGASPSPPPSAASPTRPTGEYMVTANRRSKKAA